MKSQILCSFKSRSPEYAVPETPILVPTSLKRFGLSEIINTLLGAEKIPFDFLIQNQILKTSLESYLISSNLSREVTLEIEYIQSILPPKLHSVIKQDDWISCISSNNDLYVYGSYDGQARIIDSKGSLLYTLKGHSRPIKSVIFHQNYCITGGQDSRIIVHNFKNDQIEFQGAGNGSIESLVDLGDRFAAGDSSGKIQVFDSCKDLQPRAKRVKLEKLVKKCIMELSEHSGIVSGLEYSDQKLFSCGFDHSLRLWDLETASNISCLNAQVPFTSLKIQDSLILSGHSDDTVRLWDSRSNSKFMCLIIRTSFKIQRTF
jgi:ribosome biogenesis protein YTM1